MDEGVEEEALDAIVVGKQQTHFGENASKCDEGKGFVTRKAGCFRNVTEARWARSACDKGGDALRADAVGDAVGAVVRGGGMLPTAVGLLHAVAPGADAGEAAWRNSEFAGAVCGDVYAGRTECSRGSGWKVRHAASDPRDTRLFLEKKSAG